MDSVLEPNLVFSIGIEPGTNKTGFEPKSDSKLEPLFKSASESRSSMVSNRNRPVCNLNQASPNLSLLSHTPPQPRHHRQRGRGRGRGRVGDGGQGQGERATAGGDEGGVRVRGEKERVERGRGRGRFFILSF